MSIKRQLKSIKMIMDILSPDKRLTPALPLCTQKTVQRKSEDKHGNDFPYVLPEDEGVNTRYIKEYIEALKSVRTIDLHNIMILRHGKIIWQQSFHGYEAGIWHECYSLSKTITGIAVGFLQEEGLLNIGESISDIFAEDITKHQYNARKNVTVKHLLNMQSGVLFNESSSLNEPDWIKGYFDAIAIKKAGKIFYYDSMNSFMLSAIVKKKTGINMMEYLKPRLWQPLDITDVCWELSPCGIEKGGWGLYLTLYDAAKLGQLFLNGGKWKGQAVIPVNIINNMLAEKVSVPSWMGDYDYGRQIWVGREDNTFLFNGIFGQNILGFTDKDMLIVSNCGNEELGQNGPFFAITHKYFGKTYFPSSVPLPKPAPTASNIIPNYDKNKRAAFIRFSDKIQNKKYIITGKNTARGALFPLISQAMHNNFSQGITNISCLKKIVCDGKKKLPTLEISVKENNNEYMLCVTFGKVTRQTIQIGAESYEIAVMGEVVYGKLSIRVSFLELACSRTIDIRTKNDAESLELVFNEIPSSRVITKNVEMIIDNVFKTPKLASAARKAFAPFSRKISSAFAPKISAKQDN